MTTETQIIKTPQSIRGLTRIGIAKLKEDFTAYEPLRMLEKAAEITFEWTQNITQGARGNNPAAVQTYSPRVGKFKMIIDGLTKEDIIYLFSAIQLANGGVSFGNMFNKTDWFGIYVEKSDGEKVQVNYFYKNMFYPPKIYSAVSIVADNADVIQLEIEGEAYHLAIPKADGTFTTITDTEFNNVDDKAKWAEIYEKMELPTFSITI